MDEQIDIEFGEEDQQRLLALRGGCSCHIHPPCSNCCEPVTISEAVKLGLIPESEIQQ